jgi:hypothetical protein
MELIETGNCDVAIAHTFAQMVAHALRKFVPAV